MVNSVSRDILAKKVNGVDKMLVGKKPPINL